MLDHDRSQILVIGPALWRFGEKWTEEQSILAVELADCAMATNTVQLKWEHLVGSTSYLITRGSFTAVILDSSPFCQLVPSMILEELSRTHWSGLSSAPLFLFGRFDNEITIHALVRLAEHDGLFVRAEVLPNSVSPVDITYLMSTTLASTARNREFLNNHQCCYQKFWPDEELEHKITLLRPVDIHAIAVDLRNLVGSPGLPGTIWDYRDDYQIWDFSNYMYEIVGPPVEAGYISFIPNSAGTVIVKRKWFTHDSNRRRETRWRSVSIPDGIRGFEDYVRSHVSGDSRFLGSFRRTRFDSTCEFTRTGNVFGFMVDWCRPLDRPDAPHLYQVEIEYLHSRTLDKSARFAIEDELVVLVEATRAYLDRAGIPHKYMGESKLTYMRSLT